MDTLRQHANKIKLTSYNTHTYVFILCCRECPLLLSTKKIHSSTSHMNDLLDEELKLFFFYNSLLLTLSTLESLSTLYDYVF